MSLMSTPTAPVEATARIIRDAGISVIPILADGSKRPPIAWKPFQSRLPTDRELAEWWGDSAHGIAVVCGAVSSGLTVIDVDDPATKEVFLTRLEQVAPDLFARLCMVHTPRPGLHLYVRIRTPRGNEKLACTPARQTLIETRGEGGYAIAPGSPAACHPAGKLYTYMPSGPHIEDAPLLSAEEEEFLWDLCRSFDASPPRIVERPQRSSLAASIEGEDRPGDAYNRQVEWEEVLLAAGWSEAFTAGDVTHWCRPGKSRGTSGTTGACGDYFYCFSSNAAPLEPGRAYSKFAVFALTQHEGDWRAAAQAARERFMATGLPAAKATSAKPAPETPTFYEATELGNAYRLHALHHHDMRFSAERKQWLFWRGGRWQVDQQDGAMARAARLGEMLARQARQQQDADQRKAALKFAFLSQTQRMTSNALRFLRSFEGMTMLLEEFDQHPELLACPNGTIDLTTGQFRDSRAEDYLTACTTVVYDPSARCPRWEAFLSQVMCGDADLVAYLQRLIGYCCTGFATEHNLWVFYGTGCNGKSTFLETISHLLGSDYACQTPADLLLQKHGETHPADLAMLRGKRLAMTSELDGEARLSNARIKNLTGGDMVTARFLYGDYFSFKPTHKLLMATNHPPKITEHTVAMRRRLKVIPWMLHLTPDQLDLQLPRILRDESAGILNWAIAGARDWSREGLRSPASVEASSADHFAQTDLMQEFLDLFTERSPQHWCSHGELYAAYVQWCEERKERPMATTTFGEKLSERPELERRKQHQQRGWQGVRLRSPAAAPDFYRDH